jgi:hypothetical protein
MGPVQYIFLAIGLTITLVGLARRYDKELGNSIIFMIAIAVIGFITERYQQQLAELASSILGVTNIDTFMWFITTAIFVAIVFASYSGITFNYGGKPVSGFFGWLLSLGVGLFNGYLVAGTLWYYANLYNYPLGGVQQPLNAQATEIIALLPQNLFPDPIYWVVPAGILLLLRIRG